MGRKVMSAAVHSAPVFMDKAATIKKAVGIIENAGKQGLELLVFPETYCPGKDKIILGVHQRIHI